MKSIKEQYKVIVCGWNDERTENVSNRCVEIADDYAIEFAEWVINNLYDFPKTEQKYLLEIFKKEKGL